MQGMQFGFPSRDPDSRGLRRRLSFDRAIPLLAAATALPGLAVALVLLWTADLSSQLRWTLTGALVVATAVGLVALRERLVRPLQTLANMLAALREEDYSMRARASSPEDSLGLLALEVNTLGDLLREQRLEMLEAAALLRRVMEEIDVAVLAFDDEDRVRLMNRAASELLGRSAGEVVGQGAGDLGLEGLLAGDTPRVVELAFPGRASRWEVRRTTFRQDGVPHRLVVLSDLSRVLREEERKAWQRLVRVLSHEINNSLAPIRSIAESLRSLLERDGGEEMGRERREELAHGLDVISGRSEALGRFMSSYARLARLPEPELERLDVDAWIRRVVGLETRVDVEIEPGRSVELLADGDQLEQLLINLLDNAVDAADATGGGVRVEWSVEPREVEIRVLDDGPGIPDTENLFVPFFSTKPEGSGIGLALSRQIAEAHGGTLVLENRSDAAGCVARLRLPRRRRADDVAAG